MKTACLVFLVFATPAFAQQASDPLMSDVLSNWQAESVMHANTGKSVQALAEAYARLKDENAKLQADIAAKPKEPLKEP